MLKTKQEQVSRRFDEDLNQIKCSVRVCPDPAFAVSKEQKISRAFNVKEYIQPEGTMR